MCINYIKEIFLAFRTSYFRIDFDAGSRCIVNDRKRNLLFVWLCLCVNAPPHVSFDVLRRSQVNAHRILLKYITFSYNIRDGLCAECAQRG